MPAFGYTQPEGGSSKFVFRGEYNDAEQDDPVWEESQLDEYTVLPSNRYQLRVTGFTDPVVDEKYPVIDNKTGKKLRDRKTTDLELEVIDGEWSGHRFFWRFQTWTLYQGDNSSNLGRILQAADRPNDSFDNLIGAEFQAFVQESEETDSEGNSKYAVPTRDTIRPIPAAKAAPAKKASGFGAKKANPFDENADDVDAA